MPWCDTCSRYLTTPSLEQQRCPSCGHTVRQETDHDPETLNPQVKVEGLESEDAVGNVPWHFWLVLAAVGGYLFWRVIQAVIWLLERV